MYTTIYQIKQSVLLSRVVNTSNLLEYTSIIAINIVPRPLVEQFPIKI